MSDQFSEEMLEDLGQDEAEGAAEAYDAGDDEADAGEEGDEFLGRLIAGAGRVLGGLAGGGGESFDELEEFDEGDGFDEFAEEGEGAEFDALDDAAADALGADDSDEFFRRLRNIGRVVGRVARVVAPIASAIPLPMTQAIGRVAQVAGRVLADGGDEFEALEDAFDAAEAEDAVDAAAPVLAALTLRSRMPGIARAPRTVRRQLVRSVSQATRQIARQRGPRAARAVPGVVQRVQAAVRRRTLPARRVPQAVRTLARRAAASPRAVATLARQARATAPATSRHRHLHRHRGGHPGRTFPAAVGGVTGRGVCACGRPTRAIVVRGPTRITVHPR